MLVNADELKNKSTWRLTFFAWVSGLKPLPTEALELFALNQLDAASHFLPYSVKV